ncbi:hypothetical protein I6B53_00885 [Schaalia sp. 19OD2882]|uniref:variant leucine-rich repeat-containing protein n=1 Tax=Schaalia sp. 19OD2882 TaxID=2794089 RepID=UPI001C1E9CBF|nr:hypothetical protein [Schaalia sp. 19OD2882]QWW19727.1 hypothetical protein I6B53_00885 [Schaalia sp. 19OD2882]
MANTQDPRGTGLAAAASNPATDAATLREIAYHYPHLRPVVAAHENAYPGLLQWLASLQDPAVDAALAARASRQANPAGPQTLPGAATEQLPAAVAPQVGQPPVVQRVSRIPHSPDPTPWSETPAAGFGESGADAAGGGVAAVGASGSGAAGVGAFGTGPAFAPARADAVHSTQTSQWSGGGWDSLASSAAADPDSATEASRRGGSMFLWAVLGVLVIAAVVLVTLVYMAFTGQLGGGTDPGPKPGQEQPAPSVSQSSAPDPQQSDAADEIKYPAPSGAHETESFMSPSKNITCFLNGNEGGEQSLVCTIGTQEWAKSNSPACQGGGSSSLVLLNSGAGLACQQGGQGADQTPAVLPYGEYAHVGPYACQSTQDGVSCWDTRSGAAMALAKGGWMKGEGGMIPVQEFSW